MLDVNNAAVLIDRRTFGRPGRFVLFTATDVQPSWPIPWWGVIADTGGDGHGLLVRLDAGVAPAGWTARQLLTVVTARMAEEDQRRPTEATHAALVHLGYAAVALRRPAHQDDEPVTFEPGSEPSPYVWTVARCGEFHLPLCPDPEGMDEGITPEQLLIILDQLMLSATQCRVRSLVRDYWVCRRHVAAALAAEVRRCASLPD